MYSTWFSRPGCGLYILLPFLIFNDSCQTNYFNIYRTDLCQIFKIGRNIVVDDLSESSFSIPQGTMPWQLISVGFIHKTEFR